MTTEPEPKSPPPPERSRSSGARSSGARSSGARSGGAGRALLRKPAVWFSGIVVAALGVTLTNALVPTFSGLLDPVLQRGPAVEVLDAATFRSEAGESVVFPRGTTFTAADLAALNAQTDTAAWLEARGGSPPGTVFVRLVLAGNRTDPVRIIDVAPVARCTAPLDGVLFEDPRPATTSRSGSTSTWTPRAPRAGPTTATVRSVVRSSPPTPSRSVPVSSRC